MPLHVRSATAFRWRPTMLAGQATDLVRVRDDGGVTLAALANGYECGFSACWPPASRLVLDYFVEEWAASSGPVNDRLFGAFERARRRFVAQSPSLIKPDPDFPDDLPGTVLLAVAIEGTSVHAVWIGGDVAILARGFGAAGATTPHTLRERFAREHPEHALDPSQVPNVVVRTIAPHPPDDDPPGIASFEARGGDTIVLLSKSSLRGPCVSVEGAAFAAAAHASPTVLAERLAELAFADDEPPYAAVAVLRVDDVDVPTAIDRLIDVYEPDPSHGAWLRAWSREERALPVAFDAGGVLGMRRDGSVVSVGWDERDRAAREETSGTAHLAAVVGASQKYATLATLAPRRPRDAEDCPHCATVNCEGEDRRGCPMCWYLGWQPPAAPAWFPSNLGAPADATTNEPKPKSRSWWTRLVRRSG